MRGLLQLSMEEQWSSGVGLPSGLGRIVNKKRFRRFKNLIIDWLKEVREREGLTMMLRFLGGCLGSR